ncbi:MAG TPA: XRE family transcriptional regulator, partial [Brevundimonas sp.]
RPGLFRPDVQRRLTAVLETSPENLVFTATGIAPGTSPPPGPSGFESNARGWDAGSAPPCVAIERLQLSNDDLAPWAASGVVLEIDPARWPRRDQGCVIDLVDGSRLIRLYERADADRLYLRGGPGGLGTESALARDRTRRVAAVIARLDP